MNDRRGVREHLGPLNKGEDDDEMNVMCWQANKHLRYDPRKRAGTAREAVLLAIIVLDL